MPDPVPVVLTIAGFDPSSGAGITADIKTIAAHGCYGVSCISALTVQSTAGVRRVVPVTSKLLAATLEELNSDVPIAAVHIGMLANGKLVSALATFLQASKLPNVVLDPILKSSSGTDLLDHSGRRAVVEKLLPLATVITPNAAEAAALTGLPVSNPEEMALAASKLHGMGASAVVITGGELEKAIDLLSFPGPQGPQQELFKAERQKSSSTHGTGCAFSTAMACHLALGRGLPEAVLLSKAYVSAAIANAVAVGKGTGPVHHLYRMDEPRRPVKTPAGPDHN